MKRPSVDKGKALELFYAVQRFCKEHGLSTSEFSVRFVDKMSAITSPHALVLEDADGTRLYYELNLHKTDDTSEPVEILG